MTGNKIQHKVFEGENIKLIDFSADSNPDVSEYGEFEGYASTWGNYDSQGDAVVKGAFTNSLPNFVKDGFIPIGHDWHGLPVATVLEAKEDDTGLYIKGQFHSTSAAQDARRVIQERISRGKSVKLSIGYRVKQQEKSAQGNLLKEVDLFETSIVTVPANNRADVFSAKDGTSSLIDFSLAGKDVEDSIESLSFDDNESEAKEVNSLLAGLTFKQHFDMSLAAVEGFSNRAKNLAELRAKEGRVLSTANETRLKALRDSLQGSVDAIDNLLSSIEKQPAENPNDLVPQKSSKETVETKSDEGKESNIDNSKDMNYSKEAEEIAKKNTDTARKLQSQYLALVAKSKYGVTFEK